MSADLSPTTTLTIGMAMGFIAIFAFTALKFLRIYEKTQEAKIENEKEARKTEDKISGQLEKETAGLSSGGYIIFDIPESKKGAFHDLLKGFEDYAKLRGYTITFSIDNSFPNKTAFKFTFDSRGINVSSAQVRQDLKEYISKVQRGESIEDLPMVLSPAEHNIVLTCLKNRINFLQHNLELEKTGAEFYRNLTRQMSMQGFGISPAQNFYIGDGNQTHSFQALNSPQSAVGTGNRLIENRLDQSIRIADSFNERSEQVRALGDLWLKLYHLEKQTEEGNDKKRFSEAVDLVHKTESEMKEGEPPEPVRIQKWLTNAKMILGSLALTEEVTEAAKKVWELFGMSS